MSRDLYSGAEKYLPDTMW